MRTAIASSVPLKLTLLVILFLSLWQGSGGSENPTMSTVPPFVQAVDFPKLMYRFDASLTLDRRTITSAGVSYVFSRRGKTFSTTIALYSDPKLAAEAMKTHSAFLMIAPSPGPVKIGDELLVYGSADSESGSLLFRRSNVFVVLGPGVPMEERLALANNLDGAFQTDVPEVMHLSNLKVPQILSVELPKSVHPGQVAMGKIEVRGTGDLSFQFACDSGAVRVQTVPIPMVIYTAPAEAMEHQFELVLATAGNLLVKKTVTISVTPEN